MHVHFATQLSNSLRSQGHVILARWADALEERYVHILMKSEFEFLNDED